MRFAICVFRYAPVLHPATARFFSSCGSPKKGKSLVSLKKMFNLPRITSGHSFDVLNIYVGTQSGTGPVLALGAPNMHCADLSPPGYNTGLPCGQKWRQCSFGDVPVPALGAQFRNWAPSSGTGPVPDRGPTYIYLIRSKNNESNVERVLE